jgi:signal transduction histidine kinase
MLVNSTEAITGSGEIIMRTYNADPGSITMEISDTGSGISPDALDHIYEPFFSTKHDASGIGLGLAITHGIIENHKGTIRVESEVGKGTTFSVTFPLTEQKDLD